MRCRNENGSVASPEIVLNYNKNNTYVSEDSVIFRAVVKRGYLMIINDNFSYFSLKPYVMTPHLNPLKETVQMRGHNIHFYAELTKIIPICHQILPLI